jgi:hypothetical protein
VATVLDSFAFDFLVRLRLGGNSLIWSVLADSPFVKRTLSTEHWLARFSAWLGMPNVLFSPQWLGLQQFSSVSPTARWSLTDAHRMNSRAAADALAFSAFGLSEIDVMHVLSGCDHPENEVTTRLSKGFWRVDKDKDPELRHTVLTLVAFHDLEEKIRDCGGDREKGIEAFLSQNDGEGWMIPETLCLADYNLGHDERAKLPQPVASRLGPRFYDWQLVQSPEESWHECHLHARNLLGEAGYKQLLDSIKSPKMQHKASQVSEPLAAYGLSEGQQSKLFE